MKTKLLKKIRKEWAIYRIDSVGNNENYKKMADRLGIPFYVSTRVNDPCTISYSYHSTLQQGKDRILRRVRSEYEPIFRKDKCTPSITKVWHI